MYQYPRSSRQQREKANRRGGLILVGCATLIAMGGAAIAVTRAPPRDQITACTQGVKPAMQTYIVADRSDRWTDNQTSLLRAALAGLDTQRDSRAAAHRDLLAGEHIGEQQAGSAGRVAGAPPGQGDGATGGCGQAQLPETARRVGAAAVVGDKASGRRHPFLDKLQHHL